MVGLKNGHIRKNLTHTPEIQLGMQKKKNIGTLRVLQPVRLQMLGQGLEKQSIKQFKHFAVLTSFSSFRRHYLLPTITASLA